ncbi:hypothetical protein IWZ03DRAFT_387929, partial [Phyllosticta citriasiana]
MRSNPSRRLLLGHVLRTSRRRRRLRRRRRTWIRRDEARDRRMLPTSHSDKGEKKKKEKKRNVGEKKENRRHPVSAGWLDGWTAPKTLVCGWLTYHVPQYGSRRSLVPIVVEVGQVSLWVLDLLFFFWGGFFFFFFCFFGNPSVDRPTDRD